MADNTQLQTAMLGGKPVTPQKDSVTAKKDKAKKKKANALATNSYVDNKVAEACKARWLLALRAVRFAANVLYEARACAGAAACMQQCALQHTPKARA